MLCERVSPLKERDRPSPSPVRTAQHSRCPHHQPYRSCRPYPTYSPASSSRSEPSPASPAPSPRRKTNYGTSSRSTCSAVIFTSSPGSRSPVSPCSQGRFTTGGAGTSPSPAKAVALKNLVGTTPRTNWLPRHTEGTPAEGGDQFAESSAKRALEGTLMRNAKKILFGRFFLSKLFVPLKKLGRMVFGDTKEVVRSGNWHGNNIAWRMILDLHKCFFYFDGRGVRRNKPLRYLTIVDGIIGGDGDGPMSCDPVPSGVILAGTHPVAVDCVSAQLMGFNWKKTRLLNDAFAIERLPITGFAPADITVASNKPEWRGPFEQMRGCFEFRCHFGWAGHLESDERLAKA